MKFQVKALVAALALSAAALPAQAAFTNGLSGDSSFFLTVIDNTNNISSLYDLGFTNSQFNDLISAANSNGGTYTWDLTQGDYAGAWTTFWEAATNGPSLQWAVMSSDNTGSAAGSRNLITTYQSGTKVTNSQLSTALTNFDTYLDANKNLGNHATATNGASTATSGNAYAGAGIAYGATGKINATGYDTTNLLDTTATLRQVTLSGMFNALTPAGETLLQNAEGNYTFSLSSSGVLTFTSPLSTSPVPEADSYAMLLAGLGVVGLIARRRKA